MARYKARPFQPSFNVCLKVGVQDSRVTSESGLILVRELGEQVGFGELIDQYLTDSRGRNAQFCFSKPSEMAPVRKHAATDGGFAAGSWVGLAGRQNQSERWG